MISVTVEVTEGAASRRVRITAPSIARALTLAGGNVPDRSVRVVFPIAPEDFFTGRTSTELASAILKPDAA